MRVILLLLILLATNSYAADINYKPSRYDNYILLHIEGEIVVGDYDKMVNLIRTDPEYYLNGYVIIVNSNGGNILESIKIANLIKKTFRRIEVSDVCASSCFNIFIGATDRTIGDGKLGVHRPYFSKELFTNLKAEEAEKLQNSMMTQVRDFLASCFVPQSILDKMFATPSTKIYWLNKSELAMLGNKSSWYDEYITAKCDYNDRDEKSSRWALIQSNYKLFLDSFSDAEKKDYPPVAFDFKKYYEKECEGYIKREESRNYIYNELLATKIDKKIKSKKKPKLQKE